MADDALAALARAILEVRRDRRRDLPAELFGGEIAYELLLVLFVADSLGRRLTGRTALDEVEGTHAVGRRWIEYLTREELIIGDGDGNLDDTLTLTPRALNALERWLTHAGATLNRTARGSNAESQASS